MSLHKFAEQVAANGRGDDSLLVHMTPDEVRNLQKFAQANGTTLTINPTTGLPEAGLLSDLFKAVAPIALGAFLGPGAFGIAGLGMSAGMAGAAVGGLTTLATGSLSRGLMAGLGAYGGAGLAEGFMGAGVGAAQQSAMGALTQDQITAQMAESGLTQQGVLNQAAADATTNALANTGQAVSSGFSAATASPSAMGSFAKDNLKYLAAAASPIMADMMTPTTTKMPELGNTGYIRQKVYDPYTQTYTSMAPIKASEFGSRQLSDLGRGFNGGGIVALAHGGVPGYADGMLVGDQQVFDYFKNLDQSKLGSGALDAQIAKDMQTYNVGAADIARITGTQGLQGDYEKRFVQQVAQPDTTASQFLAQTSDVGLTDQALANALKNAGLSAAGQYAATHTLNDAAGIVGAPASAQNLYNAIGYTAGSLPGDTGGLAGLNANINSVAGSLQSNIDAGKLTVQQAQNLSLAEMERLGISQADIKGATGKDFGNLFNTDAADKAARDKAAADKAAADKAAADKAAADQAARDKAAADKFAADKAAADKAAADKTVTDKTVTDKTAADKAAREKAIADKAAADKAAADKALADRIAADKAARDKANADSIAKQREAEEYYAKMIAERRAAEKAAADAAAAAAKIAADKAAADAAAKALADGLSLAAAAAAADKARREAEAIARAAADKAAADAAAAANVVTSVGTVNLGTNTGVTQDTRDTTTLGTNTLATTTPGAITSNITTDGQYIGTTGVAPAVGTKVGEGTIAGTGTEASTGTTGPIINYGGTSGFSTAPLTLAQNQLAQQAADTTAAQNKQLDLYRSFVTQNPNATDLEHANFMDKINLSPDVAARATPLSGQQMKNRYYDAKYNKMTGDSQSAYNFLMGKGAYPTKSGVGEIMRPYSEATLGMPASTNQKYIFDPTTRSYKLNQDYVGTTRDATGAVNYTMSPAEIASYFKANQGQADSTTYDWAIENGVSPEQIAASTGVPLSTVAAKWRDAKAKKAAATKTTADAAAAAGKTETQQESTGLAAGGIAGFAMGGMPMYAVGGGLGSLGSYSDGGRLLRGPGDGVSDSIPATIGAKQQPARLADGEFVVPARIVSELGNGSTEAGAKKLYAMMDRVQRARGKTTGKDKVAANSRADKHLPA